MLTETTTAVRCSAWLGIWCIWWAIVVSWFLVLVLWLRALLVYGKKYREYQNTYGQPYQSPCEKNKVTRVTLQNLRRFELLLRKLGERSHSIYQPLRLVKEFVGLFLRGLTLLLSNSIVGKLPLWHAGSISNPNRFQMLKRLFAEPFRRKCHKSDKMPNGKRSAKWLAENQERNKMQTDNQQSETVTEAQGEATLAAPTLLADMELVHRQLHCVVHLCEIVTKLADCKIRLLPGTAIMPDGDLGHHLIKMDGGWTSSFMEWVGDLLNNMDANDPEEDKRWDKTFREAHDRWKNLTDELNAKSANAPAHRLAREQEQP